MAWIISGVLKKFDPNEGLSIETEPRVLAPPIDVSSEQFSEVQQRIGQTASVEVRSNHDPRGGRRLSLVKLFS